MGGGQIKKSWPCAGGVSTGTYCTVISASIIISVICRFYNKMLAESKKKYGHTTYYSVMMVLEVVGIRKCVCV